MVLRKITTDNIVRYIPKTEKKQKKRDKTKTDKSWFTSKETKQKYFTKQ